MLCNFFKNEKSSAGEDGKLYFLKKEYTYLTYTHEIGILDDDKKFCR